MTLPDELPLYLARENTRHAARGVRQQSVIKGIAEALCREHDGVERYVTPMHRCPPSEGTWSQNNSTIKPLVTWLPVQGIAEQAQTFLELATDSAAASTLPQDGRLCPQANKVRPLLQQP